MIPHLLLALVFITLSDTRSTVKVSNLSAPDFWWDLTLDRNALISSKIFRPLTFDIIERYGEDLKSKEYDWDMRFAHGSSMQWLGGNYGFWSVWKWNSSKNEDISGGGFIYNETSLKVAAGVNWLHDARNDIIVWNCFVEGILHSSLPWSDWLMKLEDGTKLGFKNEESKWGFITGEQTVMSKHCAIDNQVVGKRYMYLNGKEVESSVKRDPFKTIERRKRSPDFFGRVSDTLKNWWKKIKKFFSSDQDGDGQGNAEDREGGGRCNTIIDLMVRIIDLILGRNRRSGGPTEGPPSLPQPPGGIPQGPNGEIPDPDTGGGDPPGGADVPPADTEELDVSQNGTVRDWE